jgi:primosomal protein N' (replication factor Y)
LTVTGADEQLVLSACHSAKKLLERILPSDALVLGPAPLYVVRVNDRYRYRISVSVKNGREARRALEHATEYCNTEKAFRGVLAYAEKDPSD